MSKEGEAKLLAMMKDGDGDENGNENRKDKVPNENVPTEIDTWPPLKGWQGRVQDGKFYCDCKGNHKAVFRKSKTKNENYMKGFWRCYKGQFDPDNCGFYVWDHEAAVAKAWLETYGPAPVPVPETPEPKKEKEKEVDLGNPWTKSIPKSKRNLFALLGENSDENENAGPSGSQRKDSGSSSGAEGECVETGDPDSPSRKAAKRKRSDTPGKALENRLKNAASAEDTPHQASKEKLQNAAQAFPTPDTGKGKQSEGQAEASGSQTTKELHIASARLGEVIDLIEDEESSALTKAVLELLRSEGVRLGDSIAIQLGSLIDEEVGTHEAKVRNYKNTISRMRKKVDELEGMVLALTGDSQDDGVDLG
ncbi:hypothetical protein BDZ45DRAFT_196320 [Acephala macrosclerotiorum]|nr:hypothetical protein BDZ45DRAFT_196320 [Acephala macrosclerotiorum]